MKHFLSGLGQFVCFAFAMILSLQFMPLASGQVDTATLSGEVTDTSGAYVPSAQIMLQEVSTGVESRTETNGFGIFVLSALKPGRYLLNVSKSGFADTVLTNLVLNVGDHRNLLIKVKVGRTAETVTVDGGGMTLNTTDGSVSTVIDRKFVQNIPLNGRSFQDLISMTPGVTSQNPQATNGTGTLGFFGDFSVNGQRTESNYYTVDGVSGNTGAGNGYATQGAATGGGVSASTALGTTQSLVSVDALQEFRVESSTYSAEYGRSPGGQVALLTRSGTNEIHGNVFDYLRNNFFDANDWFNDRYGEPIAALRQNDFGGTIGGPIFIPRFYDGRNKSFFFASYEGLRLTQPQAASTLLVPDLYLRQQAPAALQPILNAFPLPTSGGIDYGTPTNPSLADFHQPYSLPSQIDSGSVRIDHTFGSKLNVFFRYSDTPSYSDSRSLSVVDSSRFGNSSYTIGTTSQISEHMNNEFRLGYSSSSAAVDSYLDNFGGAVPLNLGLAVGAGIFQNPNPYIYLLFANAGTSTLSLGTTSNALRQWNIVDTAAFIHGRHALKVGIDYRYLRSPSVRASPTVLALFEGPSDVISNAATEMEVQALLSATPIFHQFAAFVQDEWKVTPALSVSGGIRWEINPPPTGAGGQDAYTVSGNVSDPSTLTLAPRGTRLWDTSWYSFAPRLGVAWQAHNNAGTQTLIRSGIGVFFDTDNQVASSGFGGLGFSALKTYSHIALPLTNNQVTVPTAVSAPYTGTVYAFPEHLQLPYALEWNLSIEQALGRSQSVTISYVASNGRRQLGETGQDVTSENPNFAYIYHFYGGLSSNYQALQAKFQRSIGHGLQALASYTWAHAIDFGSTYTVLPVLRGNADFDLRNNFIAGMTWDLPSGSHARLDNIIFNGWALDGRILARSAFPILLLSTEKTDPATGAVYFSGVNYDPSKPAYLHGPQYPGGRAINGGPKATNPAFTVALPGTNGNAPRNFIRGFNETQINFAVRREFTVQEKLRFQFRAEAFNILNHPNFGYVDPQLTDASFGQATETLNQSLGTMASQYQQGGPRSMQFALKATF